MAVIYVLLPVALAFAGAALAVFLWATHSGQFDDLDTPPLRVLHDDDPLPTRADAQSPAAAGAAAPQDVPRGARSATG